MRKSYPHYGAVRLSSSQPFAPIQKPPEHKSVMSISDEIACSLDVDISSLPSDVRGTAQHLTSRSLELSKWQSLSALSKDKVEREIGALEQLKVNTERQLEERKTYDKFITECVKFKEDFNQLVQDEVYADLKKEQQLTNEVVSTLQNHVSLLKGQVDALKKVYAQLYVDYQDKSDAIRLITKCITHSNIPQSQQDGQKRWHITYDNWKSECNNLQNTSDSSLKTSANLRSNIQFTLVNLKNVSERQRSNTSKTMRKTIHFMKKTEEQMRWRLQEALNEKDDLRRTLQTVGAQMRNCEARKIQNASSLYTLNQRQRNELCRDEAHNSLTLQKCDLALITSGLERMMKSVHANMEGLNRRIPVLEGELQAQEKALQSEQKCQDMYQNILPLHRASMGPVTNNIRAANFLKKLK